MESERNKLEIHQSRLISNNSNNNNNNQDEYDDMDDMNPDDDPILTATITFDVTVDPSGAVISASEGQIISESFQNPINGFSLSEHQFLSNNNAQINFNTIRNNNKIDQQSNIVSIINDQNYLIQDNQEDESDDDSASTSTESLIERSKKYMNEEAGIIILKRDNNKTNPKNFNINLDFDLKNDMNLDKSQIESVNSETKRKNFNINLDFDLNNGQIRNDSDIEFQNDQELDSIEQEKAFNINLDFDLKNNRLGSTAPSSQPIKSRKTGVDIDLMITRSTTTERVVENYDEQRIDEVYEEITTRAIDDKEMPITQTWVHDTNIEDLNENESSHNNNSNNLYGMQRSSDNIQEQNSKYEFIERLVEKAAERNSIREQNEYYSRQVPKFEKSNLGEGIDQQVEVEVDASVNKESQHPRYPVLSSFETLDLEALTKGFDTEDLNDGKLVLYITQKQLLQLLNQRAIVVPNKQELLSSYELNDRQKITLIDENIRENLDRQSPIKEVELVVDQENYRSIKSFSGVKAYEQKSDSLIYMGEEKLQEEQKEESHLSQRSESDASSVYARDINVMNLDEELVRTGFETELKETDIKSNYLDNKLDNSLSNENEESGGRLPRSRSSSLASKHERQENESSLNRTKRDDSNSSSRNKRKDSESVDTENGESRRKNSQKNQEESDIDEKKKKKKDETDSIDKEKRKQKRGRSRSKNAEDSSDDYDDGSISPIRKEKSKYQNIDLNFSIREPSYDSLDFVNELRDNIKNKEQSSNKSKKKYNPSNSKSSKDPKFKYDSLKNYVTSYSSNPTESTLISYKDFDVLVAKDGKLPTGYEFLNKGLDYSKHSEEDALKEIEKLLQKLKKNFKNEKIDWSSLEKSYNETADQKEKTDLISKFINGLKNINSSKDQDALNQLNEFVNRISKKSSSNSYNKQSSSIKSDRLALETIDNLIKNLREVANKLNRPKLPDQIKKSSLDFEGNKIIIKTTKQLPSRVYITGSCDDKKSNCLKKNIVYSYIDDYNPSTRVYDILNFNDNSSKMAKTADLFNSNSKLNYTLKSFDPIITDSIGKPTVDQLNKYLSIINTGLKNKNLVQIHPILDQQAKIKNNPNVNCQAPVTEPIMIESSGYPKYVEEISKHFGGLCVTDFPIYVQGLDFNYNKEKNQPIVLMKPTSK